MDLEELYDGLKLREGWPSAEPSQVFSVFWKPFGAQWCWGVLRAPW